jgi:hypothetical protein
MSKHTPPSRRDAFLAGVRSAQPAGQAYATGIQDRAPSQPGTGGHVEGPHHPVIVHPVAVSTRPVENCLCCCRALPADWRTRDAYRGQPLHPGACADRHAAAGYHGASLVRAGHRAREHAALRAERRALARAASRRDCDQVVAA